MRSLPLAACSLVMLVRAPAGAALDASEVLILVNQASQASSRMADLYRQLRKTAPENVLRLELPTNHVVSREEYRSRIAPAVKKRLEENRKIRCLLTTPDFPYTIQNTPGKEDGAAVDNELATVLRPEAADLNRWQPNPVYIRGSNPYGVSDPRAFGTVYVARLDGPDAKVIARMVEDAIATEQSGLYGPVFGDTQGIDGNASSGAADASIRAAIDRLAGAGFPATVDLQQETWRAPAGGVGQQAAGAAFYIGWYSLQAFQNVFGQQGLARGAVAWHIASGEAISPWSASSTEWCPNLLRRGAAATLGPAFEPYLGAFPKAEIFVEQLLQGRTIAESYWLALPHVSWAMVLLGDPLYRPFAQSRAALVVRGYLAETSDHVLRAGQTAPLLVRVECVGPANSGTPALTARAEAGWGLAGAAGKVEIPALRAGQGAVVRVPSATAGKDPTGLFRLNLNVETPGEASRRIVVDGRAGFALLMGSAGRLSHLFSSPRGSYAIAGLAGAVALVETAALTARSIRVPNGWAVASAAFSPDEKRFVLTLVQPAEKQAIAILAETSLASAVNLPGQMRFLRWQSNEKLLVADQNGLAEYSLKASSSAAVAAPSGWTANSVIAGTDIAILKHADGGWAIRKGNGAPQRVLDGVKTVRETAVADDLSIAGGLDSENRLWIQRGLAAKPQVVAESVGRLDWGPISRRVAVASGDGETRIYDGKDGSWTRLGQVLSGMWSADERRFVYITGGSGGKPGVPESLLLWDDGRTREVCAMHRVGDVGAMSVSQHGETLFLLAGPDGGLQLWMAALPSPSPFASAQSPKQR